jgi:hypothetical protein
MAKKDVDNISGTDVLQAPPTVKKFSNNVQTNKILRLANDKRRGTVSLDVEEDTIDPETGRVRRMRWLRGAQSPWFDEQSPTVFPQSYVNKNTMMLQFDKGVCTIPMNDPMAIKVSELTMRNIANKKKYGDQAKAKDIYFYEWNPVEQNKIAIEEENEVIKAMQMASTTPVEEMVAHAQYLNIQFADEMGVGLDEEALRTAYIRKAKNEPKKFINSAKSPVVKMSHMVRKAIDNGLIDLGKQPGQAYWTDGGFISTLPQGRDAVEYLIEFAMTHGESNASFANQLRELTS